MKSILLTGASGFLGKCIYNHFINSGLEFITSSRTNSSVNVDLTVEIPNLPRVDIVIHSAGKAHSVPKTSAEKQLFFDVNLTGTSNLLKGLEQTPGLPKSFVFISTIAVYGLERGLNISEDTPLNAKEPYGKSKIEAEHLVQNWCKKNDVICAILRLPLLVGENPPGNLGAMIRGIKGGYYFNIAGGKAKKSMVLTADVASIISAAAKIGGIYNLTDGYHPSFRELSASIAIQLGKAKPISIPFWLARIMGKIGDMMGSKAPINSKSLAKITADLTFDDSKAKRMLGWKPTAVLDEFNAQKKQ